jgi:hypothetical protein
MAASGSLLVMLRKVIRKYGKHQPPQFTVVMRRQFWLDSFEEHRDVREGFQRPF